MRSEVGGFRYADEALNVGASYDPRDDKPVEVILLVDNSQQTPQTPEFVADTEGGSFEGETDLVVTEKALEAEAVAVAQRVAQLLEEEVVSDGKGGFRKVQPRDIAILMRNVKNRANTFAQALSDAGIPAYSETGESFFDRAEISVMISLLRVIDNPLQDIHVAAVLRSPLYGATPDDLAQIRLSLGGDVPYIACVHAAAESNIKAARFVEQLQLFRAWAQSELVESLLVRVYEMTSALSVYAALPQGSFMQTNLRFLLQVASAFERGSFRGLYRFIRHIDAIRKRDNKRTTARFHTEDSDCVRVLSIHKSKGLEFPIVILCDTAHRYNKQDRQGQFLLHTSVGIGIKMRDPVRLVDSNTLQRAGVRAQMEIDAAAEEIRCLYVAMTRAQERLIIYANAQGGSSVRKMGSAIMTDGCIHAEQLIRAQSPAEMLLLALQCTQVGGMLSAHYGTSLQEDVLNAPVSLSIQNDCSSTRIMVSPTIEAECPPVTPRDFMHQIAPIAAPASTIPAKLTVTRLSKYGKLLNETDMDSGQVMLADRVPATLRLPAFMSESLASPIEQGNALHELVRFAFMQNLHDSPKAEIDNLVSDGFLSEAQQRIIPLDRVHAFTSSVLFRRMTRALTLHKELRFTVLCASEELLPDLPTEAHGEEVMLQGVIDCVFWEEDGWVVVDYKTDRVARGEVLAERYNRQLSLYRMACERMTAEHVKECLIYSFHLDACISVHESVSATQP